MTSLSKILLWFLAVIFLAGIFALGALGTTRQEEYECRKWETQASEYPNYYITSWQDAQCRSNGIQINAPIK